MQDLKVLLVQSDTVWERPTENLANLDQLLEGEKADLVLLAEMFSTGFVMQAQALAETMEGPTVTWMKEKARSMNAVMAGSIIIKDAEKCFNRLLWVSPQGQIEYYDKRHLFGLLGENQHYGAGSERKIFTLNGWRICPQICYDLRFPVWCRNQNDYDVLLVAANWPAARQQIWNTLLRARAIENQSYVLATNRVGQDGNNLEYAGGSQLIDALGQVQKELDATQQVCAVTLKHAELSSIRSKFPFLQDRDQFSIKMSN